MKKKTLNKAASVRALLLNIAKQTAQDNNKVRGDVGGVAFTLQIDIGFGDEIVPSPVEIDFPVILDNPVPRIQA